MRSSLFRIARDGEADHYEDGELRYKTTQSVFDDAQKYQDVLQEYAAPALGDVKAAILRFREWSKGNDGVQVPISGDDTTERDAIVNEQGNTDNSPPVDIAGTQQL